MSEKILNMVVEPKTKKDGSKVEGVFVVQPNAVADQLEELNYTRDMEKTRRKAFVAIDNAAIDFVAKKFNKIKGKTDVKVELGKGKKMRSITQQAEKEVRIPSLDASKPATTKMVTGVIKLRVGDTWDSESKKKAEALHQDAEAASKKW